jgi:hypothetical protein
VEAVPVARGEMVVQVQVLRAAHKIQAQASHQIFQVHRWNMAVVEMEIMVALQELPEMVQEVWILFHLRIVAAADHKCRTADTKAMQVALVL